MHGCEGNSPWKALWARRGSLRAVGELIRLGQAPAHDEGRPRRRTLAETLATELIGLVPSNLRSA